MKRASMPDMAGWVHENAELFLLMQLLVRVRVDGAGQHGPQATHGCSRTSTLVANCLQMGCTSHNGWFHSQLAVIGPAVLHSMRACVAERQGITCPLDGLAGSALGCSYASQQRACQKLHSAATEVAMCK